MSLVNVFSGTQSILSIALAILCLLSSLFIRFLTQNVLRVRKLQKQRIDVPIINLEGDNYAAAHKAYMSDLKNLLQRGYKDFKHGIYQLWSIHGFITIVSPDFLEELDDLPPGTIDFYEATQKRMVGNYEWITMHDQLETHTILKDLTREYGNLLHDLEDEIEYAIRTEFPMCKEWNPVTVHPVMLRIVAIVTGRVFVGAELNRNEEWLHISINFMLDVLAAASAISKHSPFMRPIAARFLVPEISRVWAHQTSAKRLLVPIMKQRKKCQDSDSSYQKPNDMISWLMDNNAKEANPRSFSELAKLHLLVSFAALHTTTQALTHIFYDLAAHPEYLEPLRKEISATEEAFGGLHSKHTYNRMIKMDSFMKESQRLNPPSLLMYSRLVMKEVTLKNGLKLIPGTYILCPVGLVSLDGEFWDSPNEFRGFRFAEMRSANKEDAHKLQFAIVTPRTLHFGYGRQACPGRFFASYEIKAITSKFLVKFDVQLVDEKAGRPVNKSFGAAIVPDESAKLLFRERS